MSSFVRFVLKYKHSDCPWGDLARDTREAEEVKRTWGFRSMKKYLEKRGACDRAMDTLAEMGEEYTRQQARLFAAKT